MLPQIQHDSLWGTCLSKKVMFPRGETSQWRCCLTPRAPIFMGLLVLAGMGLFQALGVLPRPPGKQEGTAAREVGEAAPDGTVAGGLFLFDWWWVR